MYASTSQSEPGAIRPVPHQRVSAAAAATFKHDRRQTRLDRLYQQGSAKIRFPKTYCETKEAVLINTAGGLTGGDRLDWELLLEENARVVASTQACEKAYRSLTGAARVATSIQLAGGSEMHWLPQETILYDGSCLQRNLTVEMQADAKFLALEPLVLGREAMGENADHVRFHDRWRVYREGQLIFADDLRLASDRQSVAGMGNMRSIANFLYVGPESAEERGLMVRELRRLCAVPFAGFSAVGGKIVGRILAQDSYQLRQVLVPVLKHMRGCDLPRVWRI